jgi:hypothetical protein
MAARIGNVLYWLGCILAGLITLLAVGMYLAEQHNKNEALLVSGFVLIFALVSWSVGWACRYILSGK